jgi:primosomal protein N' (replication factor Y)
LVLRELRTGGSRRARTEHGVTGELGLEWQLQAANGACRYVETIVGAPVAGRFTYALPEGAALGRGTIVEVPFGRRTALALVMSAPTGELPAGIAPEKIREVLRALPVPPLGEELIGFIDWVARYTVTPPGIVLAQVLRSRQALEAPAMETWYRASGIAAADLRLTPARSRVLTVAADGLARPLAALAEEAGVTPSVVRGLIEHGALAPETRRADPLPFRPDPLRPGPALSREQAAAAQTLKAAVERGGFAALLLDGVTGSGKTEVYFEAIAAALSRRRQALVLLPEIALTGQFLERFAARFGCPPVLWHSDIGSLARRRAWRAVAEGTAEVVVGARSALFLPFTDLGLVVVDEEHDQSYKQEDGLHYQARDMAVVRARFAGAPIVLASATPSLETDINAKAARFERLVLPARHAGAVLPQVAVIDLRRHAAEAGRWLSPPLVAAMAETLAQKEQVLLFLNRRGYAPLTICRACGHRMMSPHASSWLVEHRFTGRLVCHQTGFSMMKPAACPACGTPGSLSACGPGVERIEEEVRERFAEARIAVASSDMFSGPTVAQEMFEAMRSGEIDILIGTQIVAKGHHFPNLTLVGVVDADLGLAGGDLRAAERTYQLLHQVAGRAGRAERPGRVLLQTFMPEHPVMAALASGARDRFLAEEARAREEAGMPPYGRLAAVILSARSEAEVMAFGRNLLGTAPATDNVRIFGPASAPIAMVRGRHRARLLVKAPRTFNLSAYMEAWLAAIKVPSGLRAQIDIDPYSFL